MPKEDLKLLGKVYELNCLIGALKAKFENSPLKTKVDAEKIFTKIQNNLFRAQAKIAESDNRYFVRPNVSGSAEIRQPKDAILDDAAISLAETARHYELCLPKLNHFIIPEGSELSASIFYLGAFTRNVILEMDCYSNPFLRNIVEFLERFAYFLFVFARYINFLERREEREPNYAEGEK